MKIEDLNLPEDTNDYYHMYYTSPKDPKKSVGIYHLSKDVLPTHCIACNNSTMNIVINKHHYCLNCVCEYLCNNAKKFTYYKLEYKRED